MLIETVQDTPLDAPENPGIEGKQHDDPYAGTPSEEHLDEYADGWLAGKGQHKGANPRPRDHEEEDVVEVRSPAYKNFMMD